MDNPLTQHKIWIRINLGFYCRSLLTRQNLDKLLQSPNLSASMVEGLTPASQDCSE